MSVASLPVRLGPAHVAPTVLAERAIATMTLLGRKPYALAMDAAGAVWLDRVEDVIPTQWIATASRKADPDWLADEIRAEREARA